MKQNWWLGAQTLISLSVSARCLALAGMLKREKLDLSNLADMDLPPVSVIVPARNETANIERCVRSLLAQDYPDFELIVVDDGSEDATPAILARLRADDQRLKILTLSEALPPGWAGKTHAMQRGFEQARFDSRWLLFSDADTYHLPPALRTTVTLAVQESVDLYSLLPRQELNSLWEKILLPFIAMGITLQYPLSEVNRPGSKVALANGQYLLVRRSAFEKVGGYGGALKNSLLDDRDMAQAIKQAGGRILLKGGEELVAVHMYNGLGEIWRGFSKNAFAGSRLPYLTVPLLIIASLLMGALPVGQLVWGFGRWLKSGGRSGGSLFGLSLAQVMAGAFARRRFDQEFGLPPAYALSFPLAVIVFAGVMADSMYRSLLGRGVSWKGRQYAGAARTQQLVK